MNRKYKKAITKVQAAIIVIVIVAILAAGAYYFLMPPAKVKIRIVAIAHAAPGMKAVAENFVKDYPNIEAEVLLFDWETGRDKQLHEFATKAGEYDVLMWDCIYTGAFAPHCYPVDDLKAKYPDAEIFKDYADFIPTIDRQYAHWEGKRIGYVHCANVMAMFYRKDLLEDPSIQAKYKKWVADHLNELKALASKFKLDPAKIPTELTVPKTLEDLLVIGRFFTKKYNPESPTEIGNLIAAMKTHTIHWEYCWLFAPWRHSPEGMAKCGEIVLPYGDMFTKDGLPAFDPAITDMGIKVLELFKELTTYEPAPMETEWSQEMDLLGTGKAFMWAGSWASSFIDFIEKAPEEYPAIAGKIGVAPSPGMCVDGTWQVGVSKYSKHPKEAWLYCQYLMSKESQKIAWEKASSFPSRISVIEELAPKYPGIFKETFLASLLKPAIRDFVPEDPELEDSIAKWVTDYVAGAVDAETAIRELTAEWKRILGK
jgi:ABC-type glycerol-3-phosphate transport system substrate-binding protein